LPGARSPLDGPLVAARNPEADRPTAIRGVHERTRLENAVSDRPNDYRAMRHGDCGEYRQAARFAKPLSSPTDCERSHDATSSKTTARSRLRIKMAGSPRPCRCWNYRAGYRSRQNTAATCQRNGWSIPRYTTAVSPRLRNARRPGGPKRGIISREKRRAGGNVERRCPPTCANMRRQFSVRKLGEFPNVGVVGGCRLCA
jgi:hypothetical protein